MSRGTPMKAASSPSGEACTGSRIMEQTPTGRATIPELGGWFRGASEAWRLGLRPRSQSPEAGHAPRPAQREASSLSMLPAGLAGSRNQGTECQCLSRQGLIGQGFSGDQRPGRGPRAPATLSQYLFVDFSLWVLWSLEPGLGLLTHTHLPVSLGPPRPLQFLPIRLLFFKTRNI